MMTLHLNMAVGRYFDPVRVPRKAIFLCPC
jgi:hypothetical protein